MSMTYLEANGCSTVAGGENPVSVYETPFDGQDNFSCVRVDGCPSGVDVVRCVGDWAHTWPFHKENRSSYPKLAWEFMRSHRKII